MAGDALKKTSIKSRTRPARWTISGLAIRLTPNRRVRRTKLRGVRGMTRRLCFRPAYMLLLMGTLLATAEHTVSFRRTWRRAPLPDPVER